MSRRRRHSRQAVDFTVRTGARQLAEKRIGDTLGLLLAPGRIESLVITYIRRIDAKRTRYFGQGEDGRVIIWDALA